MEGLGPGVVAAVGELSQEQGPQSLVVGGPAVFLVIFAGLQRMSERV